MINSKINEEFIEKKEIIGLNKSGKASLKVPLPSACLGNNCSRTGLIQVLEKMWDLSQALGRAIQTAGAAQGKA